MLGWGRKSWNLIASQNSTCLIFPWGIPGYWVQLVTGSPGCNVGPGSGFLHYSNPGQWHCLISTSSLSPMPNLETNLGFWQPSTFCLLLLSCYWPSLTEAILFPNNQPLAYFLTKPLSSKLEFSPMLLPCLPFSDWDPGFLPSLPREPSLEPSLISSWDALFLTFNLGPARSSLKPAFCLFLLIACSLDF